MTDAMPMGFGDDWLRFNGIGENVIWGMYNNEKPTEEDRERLYRVLQWAAPRGLTATFHWHNDRSVHHLLDVLERVNRETPIAPLRWSIAHLNDASPESLKRMKALGVGWLMQNAFYFRGEAFIGQRGADAARLAPPIGSALRLGLTVGGGTDAHRVMNYNPFVSLQWMLDGKTVGGMPMRGPEETPTREEALRLYTLGSAWFSFDDGQARLADARQARRPRGADQGLSQRAGRGDRQHRVAAHHGRRPCGLCGRTLCGAGGQGRGLSVASHSITSSAMASTPGGIAKPSVFAVLRLRISSNLVGNSTGMSAGFSPLRTRLT